MHFGFLKLSIVIFRRLFLVIKYYNSLPQDFSNLKFEAKICSNKCKQNQEEIKIGVFLTKLVLVSIFSFSF